MIAADGIQGCKLPWMNCMAYKSNDQQQLIQNAALRCLRCTVVFGAQGWHGCSLLDMHNGCWNLRFQNPCLCFSVRLKMHLQGKLTVDTVFQDWGKVPLNLFCDRPKCITCITNTGKGCWKCESQWWLQAIQGLCILTAIGMMKHIVCTQHCNAERKQ